jgi:nucleoside-diphosphate-sugar epimerase
MIHWITENLGTAKRDDVADDKYRVVDVRDLVDKEGNPPSLILEKINDVLDLLRHNHKVIICCDYGRSRSNAIAIGVVARLLNYNFLEAAKFVMEKTKATAIHIGILSSVEQALEKNEKGSKLSKNNKKILITGSTGFIGSALASKIKNAYDLILPTKQELGLLKGSINLDMMVKESNVDTIIHLANPRIYTTTESMGQSLVMLKNVLDVCKENRSNLIYLSSWVVYSGYNSSYLVAPESLPLRPKGTYGEIKVLCETLVNQYQEFYGLKICLLRLSPVYGIGSDKPKFIYTFFQNALKNETIFTHKYINGLPVLDLIHINDAVKAIDSALRVGSPNSLNFNIGSGIGCSTFEIAKMIKELCDSTSKIKHHEINDFFANIVMDISKAKEALGWCPEINIQDGLKEIMRYVISKTNVAEIEDEKQ